MSDHRSAVTVVFLVSAGRSGAHHVLGLFDGHPQVSAIQTEMRFHALWRRHRCDALTDPDELIATVLERFRLREHRAFVTVSEAQQRWAHVDLALFAATLRRLIHERPISRRNTFLALHEAYYAARGNRPQDLRAIVEFAAYGDSIDQQLEDFPDARFLHVVRDPRAVAASKKMVSYRLCDGLYNPKLPGFGDRFLLNLDLALMVRHYREMYRLESRLPPERFLSLRTEDVNGDPDAAARRLSAWLRIDDHASLRHSTLLDEPFVPNTAYSPVDAQGRSRGRAWWLPARERRALELVFWRHMEFLGYQPEFMRAGGGRLQRLLAAAAWLLPFRGEVGWILTPGSRAFSSREPDRRLLAALWRRRPGLVRVLRRAGIPWFLARAVVVFLLQRILFFSRFWRGGYELVPPDVRSPQVAVEQPAGRPLPSAAGR